MTALKMRPVNHVKGSKNRYCGPSAISALTGMSTGEAARLIRSGTGKASVKGTHDGQMIRALRLCGIEVRAHETPTSPTTLAAWLRASSGKRGGRMFLISAGNHWQLVSGNRFVCGIVGEVVSLDHPKVRRRARVADVYELVAPQGVIIPKIAKAPVTKFDPNAKWRYQAKKLAALWGIQIERESFPDGPIYWVYGPEGSYPDENDDPCQGSHSCYHWDEVLDNVKRYVEDLEARV